MRSGRFFPLKLCVFYLEAARLSPIRAGFSMLPDSGIVESEIAARVSGDGRWNGRRLM